MQIIEEIKEKNQQYAEVHVFFYIHKHVLASEDKMWQINNVSYVLFIIVYLNYIYCIS